MKGILARFFSWSESTATSWNTDERTSEEEWLALLFFDSFTFPLPLPPLGSTFLFCTRLYWRQKGVNS